MKLVAQFVLVLFAFTTVFSCADFAEAKRKNHQEDRGPRNFPKSIRDREDYKENTNDEDSASTEDSSEADTTAVDDSADDAKIVRAVNDRRGMNFVEGGGMVVTKILPDDTSGLQHQKWVVRLSNGKTMQAVYNSDMCPRVPVKVGDVVAMGGQFIWTNDGGLLHWLHHDPRGRRPDGYVFVNGQYYCKD